MRGLLLGLALMATGCGSLSGRDHDRVIYVRNDGADLMVWVRGNVDSGVIVVVTHGGPGSYSSTYSEDLWPLEDDYAFAYWDQRASGSSRGLFSPERYTYAQFGDDLSAVIRTLHHVYAPDDVFLMGHSFGVEVGTEFLVTGDNQDLVSGWIPVNGTSSVSLHARAQRDYVIDRVDAILADPESYASYGDDWLEQVRVWRDWCVETPFPDPFARDYLDTVWGYALSLPGYSVTDPDPIPYAYRPSGGFTSPYSDRLTLFNESMVYYPMDEAYDTFERGDALARVTVPTRLMWGRWDPIMPPLVGETYHAQLGTSEADKALVWFDYSYHSPFYEEQGRFNPALAEFIEAYRR